MRRRSTILALLAWAVIGCGGDDATDNSSDYKGEKAKVATVVDELTDAARDSDGEAVCTKLFTKNLAISIRRASRHSCAQEVVENIGAKDADFKINDLNLIGNEATVKVVDHKDRRSLLQLVKEAGGWRIARIS